MAYSAKGQKKYNANSTYLSVKYTPNEQIDGERVKAYLEQTGQSANAYIKSLIKADLDSKGFSVDGATTMDIDRDATIDTDSTDTP